MTSLVGVDRAGLVCEAVGGGAGDITAVYAGYGLGGGHLRPRGERDVEVASGTAQICDAFDKEVVRRVIRDHLDQIRASGDYIVVEVLRGLKLDKKVLEFANSKTVWIS